MIAEQVRIHCGHAYDLPFPMDMIQPHIPGLPPARTRTQEQACRVATGESHIPLHTHDSPELTAETPGV
jgi:hypothetical protein